MVCVNERAALVPCGVGCERAGQRVLLLTFIHLRKQCSSQGTKTFLNVFFAALGPRLISVKREVGCAVPTPQMNYIPLRLIDRLSGI